MKIYNRFLDRVLLVVIPAMFFIYLSLVSVLGLRTEMPPDFPDVPASATAAQRADEERLASAYWKIALVIQPRYAYGSPLPETPPDDFRVDAANASNNIRYWRRLQQVWVSPGNWTHHYEWSMHWLTHPIRASIDGVTDFLAKALHLGT